MEEGEGKAGAEGAFGGKQPAASVSQELQRRFQLVLRVADCWNAAATDVVRQSQ